MGASLGRAVAVLGVALAVVACFARPSFAREGFYLGFGFIGQSANGDLDYKTSFTDPKTSNQYLVGSLNNGTGEMLLIGYGLNKYFGIELMSAASEHSASFQGQPDSDAILAWALLGVRLTAPISKGFELFLRVGEGAYTVNYSKYVLLGPSLTQTTDVQYSGYGSAYGAGFEILGDHFGIEFSYMVHAATLTEGKAAGVSDTFSLPHHLQVPITTSTVAFNYHF